MSVRNSAPGFWNTRGGITHLKKPSKLCYILYAKNVAVYTKNFQLKVPEITCVAMLFLILYLKFRLYYSYLQATSS